MPPRLIRLRRPPVLHAQEGPFVPELPEGARGEIDRRWTDLCRANPAYFDGRIWHVLGVHRNGHGGATIHVIECAYRYYACQVGWRDLGVRPLGVKALTRQDGRVLVGRRSSTVGQYPGLWEFAPSGGVEPGMSPQAAIGAELLEETGLELAVEPTALAMLFDDTIRTWEIVYQIEPARRPLDAASGEYDELRWVDPTELPDDLSPIATRMASLL